MAKIAFFHTTVNTPFQMKTEFRKRFPNDQLITMLEDGILPEIEANGDMYTPDIVRRLVEYGVLAQEMGACAMVCICTTLGFAVSEAQKCLHMPFITIDGPMLKDAVCRGKNIALLVTAKTTIKASSELAYRLAKECGRDDVKIDTILIEGASAALNAENDKPKHNRLIAEAAMIAAADHDVIVLAQVTMADAAELCRDLPVPVLTSIHSGLEQLTRYLNER